MLMLMLMDDDVDAGRAGATVTVTVMNIVDDDPEAPTKLLHRSTMSQSILILERCLIKMVEYS